MLALFPDFRAAPAGYSRVKLTRIQDSCGWGVPFYEFKGERDQLTRYVDNPKVDGRRLGRESRYAKNAESIDGLKGLASGGQLG